MWRFLLPALAMMAALIVLFAGALGDLNSLPDLSDRIIGIVGGVEPGHAPPPPAAAPAPSAAGAREALQREIADLQQQMSDLKQQQTAQRAHDPDPAPPASDQVRQEIAAARAEADKLRQDIDTLRQQRKTEEAALARQKAQAQQPVAAAPPPPAPRSVPAMQPPPQPPAPAPSASQQLLTARQWLATGRPDEARRILTMVQTQMVFRPVTPDQPMAEGGNPSATDIGNAIRWLDIGANNQAMLAINRAIDNVNRFDAHPQAWSGNPVGPPPAYPWPGMQDY